MFSFEGATKTFRGNPVIMTQRIHPFPYRTRKLSSAVLMILGGRLPGKVSRRRIKEEASGRIDIRPNVYLN